MYVYRLYGNTASLIKRLLYNSIIYQSKPGKSIENLIPTKMKTMIINCTNNGCVLLFGSRKHGHDTQRYVHHN